MLLHRLPCRPDKKPAWSERLRLPGWHSTSAVEAKAFISDGTDLIRGTYMYRLREI